MKTQLKGWAVAVGAFALSGLAPGIAQACSVCQAGTADNRFEFIATTALLTFLPLILIGGGVWGLRRRYLALAKQPAPDDSTPQIPVAPAVAELDR